MSGTRWFSSERAASGRKPGTRAAPAHSVPAHPLYSPDAGPAWQQAGTTCFL